VITDDPNVGAGSVLAAVGQDIGDVYDTGTEKDTRAHCTSLSATPTEEDGCQWDVTAEYGPYDAAEFPENPLSRDPEISWEYRRDQEAAEKDIDDNPVQNTAGDSFDPPLLKDVRKPILKLTRNEANFDPGLSYLFHDKVNDAPWFGAAAGYVKVEGITPQRVFNQLIGWYWQVQYEFLFDARTHDPTILNQGFKQLVDGRQVLCTDADGEVVTSPVWLDETGTQIDPTGTPVYLQFQIYKRTDFGVFNFDTFYAKLVAGGSLPPGGFSGI
jgi:hypothetical protein